MKTMGLCFVLLAVVVPLSIAQSPRLLPQSEPDASGMNLDNDAMKKLLESDRGSRGVRMYRIRPDSWRGASDADCATMRTYRVKREAADSDVVRPSGSTTCVPMAKFRFQEAVPKLEPDPAE